MYMHSYGIDTYVKPDGVVEVQFCALVRHFDELRLRDAHEHVQTIEVDLEYGVRFQTTHIIKSKELSNIL